METDPVPEEMPEICPICPNNIVVLGWYTFLPAGRDTARHEGKIYTVPLTAFASITEPLIKYCMIWRQI